VSVEEFDDLAEREVQTLAEMSQYFRDDFEVDLGVHFQLELRPSQLRGCLQVQ